MMVFKSSSHQRFENGSAVNDLQVCNRSIQIDDSSNGCSGYKSVDKDGYIVSIINLDHNHPHWGDNYQMSPKPMRLISKTETTVVLRGYQLLAQTPFGWIDFDLSDYGITLYAVNDEIVKCRLDMFDRHTYIEYYK